MPNTMEDLRREVATRLRNSMHGREIDIMEGMEPNIYHMLGITPLNKIHDPENEEMTLLDTKHPFWKDYEEDVQTKNKAVRKIETAIRSLKEDDVLRMTYPYGEEADVIYVEVDKLDTNNTVLQTSCKVCGAEITTSPSLEHNSRYYGISFSIDCPKCDFSGTFDSRLVQR